MTHLHRTNRIEELDLQPPSHPSFSSSRPNLSPLSSSDIEGAGFRFGDFLEGLARLAAASFPYSPADEKAKAGWLGNALKRLLENHVLPNAAQVGDSSVLSHPPSPL